jgi:hypothetical protein
MRVNLNSEPSVVAGVQSASVARGARVGQDRVALGTSDTLNQALGQTPEVRAEKVAEARALLQNGSYPPAVIIRKISALLAIKINAPDAAD